MAKSNLKKRSRKEGEGEVETRVLNFVAMGADDEEWWRPIRLRAWMNEMVESGTLELLTTIVEVEVDLLVEARSRMLWQATVMERGMESEEKCVREGMKLKRLESQME